MQITDTGVLGSIRSSCSFDTLLLDCGNKSTFFELELPTNMVEK